MDRNFVIFLVILLAAVAVVSFLCFRPERIPDNLILHDPTGNKVTVDDLFGDNENLHLVVMFM